MPTLRAFLQSHRGLIFGYATMGAFLIFGHSWLDHLDSPVHAGLFMLWLVPAILGAAFSVVHHADALAHRLGEPFGTLILTLSVTGMEVIMVSTVMLTGKDNPTLARDTMFAVVMIVLGGLVGTSLLVGGMRHRLQEFNLEGAAAYLSLIVPLSLVGLVVPDFTLATDTPTFSPYQAVAIAFVCVGAYTVFLIIQTMRHREFFSQEILEEHSEEHEREPLWYHVAMLVISMIPVIILAEELGSIIDYGVFVLGMPPGLAGLVVAGLILAPEGMGGIQAASQNRLQRAINLLLGSALATIALTIPAVLIVGVLTGREVVLGLSARDAILLSIMLATCVLTFSRGRTNMLQGAIHLLMFVVWIILLLED